MTLTKKTNGWRLGFLVACSVEPNTGQGRRRGGSTTYTKVSARTFAQLSDSDHKTVLKYLITWNKAADDGLVPHSNLLTPGQEYIFDGRHTQKSWLEYLSSYEGDFALDERHTPELWNKYFQCTGNPVVYFIGHKDHPELPIKIGKARTVDHRLLTFQTSHYTELEVLFTVPGYSKEERELHKKFADKHVRGEWYALTPEDLEEIREESLARQQRHSSIVLRRD